MFNLRTQRTELLIQLLIAAFDVFYAVDFGGAVGAEGGEDIGATGADIGNIERGADKRRRSANDAAMNVLLFAEAALHLPEAFGEEANMGTHVDEGRGVAKAVFVDGFVDD